jgi:ubiquinone/menaquinone biosynthesis C-methylase UbiE
MNNPERIVAKFYNEFGWETEGEITEDAKRYEDLRDCAKKYVSKCRLRVLRHIPDKGENILDMASGPIQYKEYLEYSKNFKKRYCIDLSLKALNDAKKKIGDHGVFLCGSFFDIPLESNFFDCAISLHTIYHIDKDRQEEAVRKLISVVKPGSPVIIVYANPKVLIDYFKLLFRIINKFKSLLKTTETQRGKEYNLYRFSYPLEWWDRFSDAADVKILPWRSFTSEHQKVFIPNNRIGTKMFEFIFNLEERFPNFFAKHFQFPMIILKKKR